MVYVDPAVLQKIVAILRGEPVSKDEQEDLADELECALLFAEEFDVEEEDDYFDSYEGDNYVYDPVEDLIHEIKACFERLALEHPEQADILEKARSDILGTVKFYLDQMF